MAHSPPQPLDHNDRIEIFRIATRSLVHWYGGEFDAGMTDAELAKTLEYALGIFGGSGGPDRLSETHTGRGLRIWGGWHVVNHVTEKPLFKGRETVAMARYVYRIPDPGNDQLDLL